MKTSEFVVGRRNQSSCTPHFLHGFRRWLPGATALLVLSLCAGTPCFAEEIKADDIIKCVCEFFKISKKNANTISLDILYLSIIPSIVK